MSVDTVDPNSIFSLATASTIVAFTILSTFTSLIVKNAFYLSILRDCLLFYQSIVFFIELDTFLQSTHAQLVAFLKYFSVLNGDIHTILFDQILDRPNLGAEFWSIHSFFFVKVGLFLVMAFLWEFSFGCTSYIFCFLLRERNNVVRRVFNYGRFCIFSIFYVWMLFPLCSVIVRPLFFPDAYPTATWNYVFIAMASVAMAYLLLKLMVFWMDIFVHWVHASNYEKYARETRRLRRKNHLTLTREYYQVKRIEKKRRKSPKHSSTEVLKQPIPAQKQHLSPENTPLTLHSHQSDDDMEQTTGIPSPHTKRSTLVENASPHKIPAKRQLQETKHRPHASSGTKRFSTFSIIVEPVCAVVIALRSIFVRPSILLKLSVERYENLRNIALPKLPKQNLNSAFGAAIRNYKEGDDALFEVDYVFFRTILWTVASAATTFFTSKMASDGQKYRVLTMTVFQGAILLYYLVHLPHKHWYQRFSVIFFNFLTLGVLVCFVLLIWIPDLSNQDVVHWCIYGSFVLALIVLMVYWLCSTFWRCVRCCFKLFHKKEQDSDSNASLLNDEPGYSRRRNRDDADSEMELIPQRYSAQDGGEVSHHDMVEVLTGELDDDQEMLLLEKKMSKIHTSGFGTDKRASAGLAEAHAGGSLTPPSVTITTVDTSPIRGKVDLEKINTGAALPSALGALQDNNYMMQEHIDDSDESDVSEELESIATDDSIVLDFEKFTRRRSVNQNILMTPQDEDLVPATDFHVTQANQSDDVEEDGQSGEDLGADDSD